MKGMASPSGMGDGGLRARRRTVRRRSGGVAVGAGPHRRRVALVLVCVGAKFRKWCIRGKRGKGMVSPSGWEMGACARGAEWSGVAQAA
jgi:hypothetical protein